MHAKVASDLAHEGLVSEANVMAGGEPLLPTMGSQELQVSRVSSQVKLITIDWHRSPPARSSRVRWCFCVTWILQMTTWWHWKPQLPKKLQQQVMDWIVVNVLFNTLQLKIIKMILSQMCCRCWEQSWRHISRKKTHFFFLLVLMRHAFSFFNISKSQWCHSRATLTHNNKKWLKTCPPL